MGILKMADKYSMERLEVACAKALSYTPHPTYKNISAILQSGQDKVKATTIPEKRADTTHSFIRGAKYYGGMDDAE
jgi:hypothetical protein